MPSPSQNFTPRVYHGADSTDPSLAALEAVAITVAGVAMFVAAALAIGPGRITVVFAQAALAATVIAWAIARGRPRARLGLGAPPARALAGALLIGLGFWYAHLRIASWFVRAIAPHAIDRLHDRVVAEPFAIAIAVLAVLPAICEELAFRGVLARGIRPAAGRAIAIAGSAIAFGAYHLQLSRLVPLSLFGALLASLAIASDSIWPAVLAHFLNNAIAIAISTGHLDPIAAIVSAHPDLALAASLAVTAAGLVIALAPRRAA